MSHSSKNIWGIWNISSKTFWEQLHFFRVHFGELLQSKDATHNYEIDFLVSRGSKICPIEVKSSGYKSHASLDAFSGKFSKVILPKYLFYGKDLQKDGNTLLLPFYMTSFV